MDIKIKNTLNAEDYNSIRNEVGWESKEITFIENAIKNSMYVKSISDGNKTIGMARCIGVGMYALIVDVVVVPKYQGKGIGKILMNSLLEDIKNGLKEGQTITVNLVSMKDKEGFYEKFGFEKFPADFTGYGMKRRIEK